MLKSASWIIGSSEFFHSFIFALQKIHSYQIPSQDVLGALRAHGALAKIRQHDKKFCTRMPNLLILT